jgi:hypothetical protein
MDRSEYLDFDMLFEKSGEEYVARVLNSPAGQAVSRFSLPFNPLEIENMLLRIGRTRRGVRRLESPEMETARAFGSRLFSAVFSDEILSCLRGSLNESYRQGAGLRLRLRLAAAPELGDLPWEFLYDSTREQFLVLSVETPLVRYLELTQDIEPLPVSPPLKILVMIASPQDYPPLDVEHEWAKLNEALGDLIQRGLVSLTRLDQATLAELQRQLRRDRFHIFHFIGHGAFDERSQDGVLLTEDEQGRGRMVSGDDLGTLLHDHRTLRLAVLNACEGARSSLTDPFAGSAQSLVQKGLPAVIAMQFEITDPAAITLAHEFYTALADGFSVDAALGEARKAIFAQGNDVEWATPVLYLRVPGAAVFKIETPAEKKEINGADREAASRLEAARKNLELEGLSRQAREAEEAGDWAGAIALLERLSGQAPAYQDAAARLEAARKRKQLQDLNAEAGPAGQSSSTVETQIVRPSTSKEKLKVQDRPKDRSRIMLFGMGIVLILLLAYIAFQFLNNATPALPDPAENAPFTQAAQEAGEEAQTTQAVAVEPATEEILPTEDPQTTISETEPPGEPNDLDQLTSVEELEPLLLGANILLSAPEDLERTRSYFNGPESAYHMLAVAVLEVVGDRRFKQPIHLDIVDEWYTVAAGSAYATLDPVIVEQSLIDANNDYYTDNATSLDELLEPRE